MQQTEKYQLDLIEKTDAFSPDALNQNAQKVEGALAALQTAVDGKAPASLEGRVAALELKKIVIGTYKGNGKDYGATQTISLGFTPAAALVQGDYDVVALSLLDHTAMEITIVDGGFSAKHNRTHTMNKDNQIYRFIAFA